MKKESRPINYIINSVIVCSAFTIILLMGGHIVSHAEQPTLTLGGSGQKSIEIDIAASDITQVKDIILRKRILFHPGKWTGKKVSLNSPNSNYSNKHSSEKVEGEKLTSSSQIEIQKNSTVSKNITEHDNIKVSERPIQKNKSKISQYHNKQKSTLPPATSSQKIKVSTNNTSKPISILFSSRNSDLSSNAIEKIKELALVIVVDESLRVQLKAYASGDIDSASHSRRLSLARALSVRSELIENGLRSTRIDVRALGNKNAGDISDRVDIFVIQR